MKIEQLTTFVIPPRWLFLKIETDEGVAGRGEPVVEGRAELLRPRPQGPQPTTGLSRARVHERVVVDQQQLELVRPASLLATGELTQPNSTGHRTRGDS